MSDVSQYCAACECENKPQCRCLHTCAPVVEPQQPHVHEPAGPGEYCTGCFDQGAVWAEHEERARIIAIIEDERSFYDVDGEGWEILTDALNRIAAIKGNR